MPRAPSYMFVSVGSSLLRTNDWTLDVVMYMHMYVCISMCFHAIILMLLRAWKLFCLRLDMARLILPWTAVFKACFQCLLTLGTCSLLLTFINISDTSISSDISVALYLASFHPKSAWFFFDMSLANSCLLSSGMSMSILSFVNHAGQWSVCLQ